MGAGFAAAQRAATTMRLRGGDTIEVATESMGVQGEGTIRFVREDGGTRIAYEGTLRSTGWKRLLPGAIRGAWERALTRSEGIHVRVMEEEWDRQPW